MIFRAETDYATPHGPDIFMGRSRLLFHLNPGYATTLSTFCLPNGSGLHFFNFFIPVLQEDPDVADPGHALFQESA